MSSNIIRGITFLTAALLILIGVANAGQYVYVTDTSPNISVIDGETNEVIRTIPIQAYSLAASPDGTKLFAGYETISIIDTATDVVKSKANVNAQRYEVSPDGRKLYASDNNQGVYAIDTSTGSVLSTIAAGGYAVTFNPAGTRAYAVGMDYEAYVGHVIVIDAMSDSYISKLTLPSLPQKASVSPDGNRLYVLSSDDNGGGMVNVIDVESDSILTQIPVPVSSGLKPTMITANGNLYVMCSDNSGYYINVFSTVDNELKNQIPLRGKPDEILMNREGTRVFISHFEDKSVSVINAESDSLLTTIPTEEALYKMALTPDGKFLYGTNFANPGCVYAIDLVQGSVAGRVLVGREAEGIAAVSVEKRTQELILPLALACNVSEGNAPLAIQFEDLSHDVVGVISRNWIFGDGTPESSEQTVVHVFQQPGVYPVTLTLTNASGSDSITKEITVTEKVAVLPVAAMEANVTAGPAPLVVQFSDKSQNATERSWNFGDETSDSTEASLTHTFAAEGNYTVTLTAKNGDGANSTAQIITVTKTPVVPVESLQIMDIQASTATPRVKNIIAFTAIVSGEPISYVWYFGKLKYPGGPKVSYSFNKAGTYDIKLIVRDRAGNRDEKTVQVTVLPKAVKPKANFNARPASGKAPLTVQFNDNSKGVPNFWKWNFGDGCGSEEQNPSHVYKKPGRYTVTLKVRNEGGTDVKMIRYMISVRK